MKQINGEEISKLKTEAINRHGASNMNKSKRKTLESFGESSLMIDLK